jgi:hypothetical protein
VLLHGVESIDEKQPGGGVIKIVEQLRRGHSPERSTTIDHGSNSRVSLSRRFGFFLELFTHGQASV